MRFPLLFAFLLPLSLLSQPLQLSVNCESAILMNAETGAILYQKNARKSMYPASVTKIAVALYALKVKGDRWDEIVVIDQDSIASVSESEKARLGYTQPAWWLETDATHMGLKKGEEISLKDLLYGMMVVSGNDAANAIAQNVGGTIPNFMSSLNAYLKEIGCKKTVFHNPHGLFHPKHQTTAYDLGLMAKEGLKSPKFCQIVSTVNYTRPKTNKQESAPLLQSNKLLRPGKFYYPKAIGIKTGYIQKAGHTFVAAAKHENRTLIAVLLKTKDRQDMFLDAKKLFEAAFNEVPVERVYFRAGPQKFTRKFEGAKTPVTTTLADDITLSYYPAEAPNTKCLLFWDECTFPISKGERVGELRLQTENGTVLLATPLLSQEDVDTTWAVKIKQFFSAHMLGTLLFACIPLGLIFWLTRRNFG